ncbi:MAG: ATP-binding protein [candidate division Zixibacteria bacterium]|nr:ATP-binding protein [Candidatus Tariuqbacter arcticus]
MSEKLIIKNFAGIKDAEIELNKINILIGPQATGKSVIAKLLYLFKSVPNQIIKSIIQDSIPESYFKDNFKSLFETYFPPACLGLKDCIIRYEIGDTFIQVYQSRKNEHSIILEYSELYDDLLNEGYNKFLEIKSKLKDEDREFFSYSRINPFLYRRFFERLGTPGGYAQEFMPAGRSYFANISESKFFHDKEKIPIDRFLIEFGSFYEFAKKFYRRTSQDLSESQKTVDAIISKILYGSYIQEENIDYVKHIDGRKVNITHLSSGQQEVLPISLVLRMIVNVRFVGKGITMYIEEPEAHLFPNSQRDIVKLLATVFKLSVSPLQLFITTHSPYILTAFANLMEAGIVRKKAEGDAEKLKKLYDIVPEEQILDPSVVNAYNVTHDGIKSIIDDETGLILADEIDDVSDETSEQFNKLLELEY